MLRTEQLSTDLGGGQGESAAPGGGEGNSQQESVSLTKSAQVTGHTAVTEATDPLAPGHPRKFGNLEASPHGHIPTPWQPLSSHTHGHAQELHRLRLPGLDSLAGNTRVSLRRGFLPAGSQDASNSRKFCGSAPKAATRVNSCASPHQHRKLGSPGTLGSSCTCFPNS